MGHRPPAAEAQLAARARMIGRPARLRDRARRLMAVAAFILAGGALVATSRIAPSSSVSDTVEGRAPLTSESPVAVVPLTVVVSDEALWSDDPDLWVTSATLEIQATGEWVVTGGSSARAEGPERPTVRMTVTPAGGGEPVEDAGELGTVRIDLREVCPRDLDCELAYDVILEWVDSAPGPEVSGHIEATSQSTIEGLEEQVVGADTSVTLGEPAALDVPVLSDGVGATVLLDAAHPLAMWTVVIDANDAALAGAGWPVRHRGAFTATVTSHSPPPPPPEPGEFSGITSLLNSGVRLTVIPDGEEELQPAVDDGAAETSFDPFGECVPLERCSVEFTVVARWFAADLAHSATVDWRLDAGILYFDEVEPSDDASVSARMEHETFIGPAGPVLADSISGVIDVAPGSDTIPQSAEVELSIAEAAVRESLLGGPVPAVSGVLTLQARSERPIDGEPFALGVNWSQAGPSPLDVERWRPEVNGAATRIAVVPALSCRGGQACTDRLRLLVDVGGRARERIAGNPVTLEWTLELQLRYPEDTVPPPGGLRLTHVEPDG